MEFAKLQKKGQNLEVWMQPLQLWLHTVISHKNSNIFFKTMIPIDSLYSHMIILGGPQKQLIINLVFLIC